MKASKYTLDINNMREFLFSRLVTQLFLGCVVGCLFFNIAIEPPAKPVPKASEADRAKANVP